MFPSLRARAFFNSAVSEIVTKPIWQPAWYSIDEIMERIAGIKRAERIVLISELHKVYTKHILPAESFDKFYFWGEMLVSDFDMIDRYMVDASQLLRNIEDIKELEADVSYLTPEQLRIVSFWKSIGDNDSLSEQKQRFLKVWRNLPKIYEEYRQRLMQIGLAYSGMIYRYAAERIKRNEPIELPKKRFVIAGFNALSQSEKVLFDYLSRREEGADFFWDYDDYYTANREHEAGMFMRENIARHPSAAELSHNNFVRQPKRIDSIACVSNVVQCKYVAEILRSLPREELDKRTAIVLTDESMLIPLLHSLPKEVERVNITMGYPLKNTLVYSFIERLIELQTHSHTKDGQSLFYHIDCKGILTHPYIVAATSSRATNIYNSIVADRTISVDSVIFQDNELLRAIFVKTEDWHSLAEYIIDVIAKINYTLDDDPMQSEYLRIAHEQLQRLVRSIDNCDISLLPETFISLLRRHLQTINMPYEGEPLEGVQIMGILETRNIDFKNVIILSMTDANFPGDMSSQSSFIPYNLRAAYSLPTPEQHEAMYAYYFYRLIQRAENISMLYCSRADDKSTGERSRYIYQLEYEAPHTLHKHAVGVDLNIEEAESITIPKDSNIRAALEKYLDEEGTHYLSPTALFRYVECPVKFYFNHIAHLRTADEISDTIDALTFGNIMHEAMQDIYTPLIGIKNPQSQIEKLRKRECVEAAVDGAIRKLMYNSRSVSTTDFSGDTLLVRDIIIKYIMRGIMRYDKENEEFTIKGLEDNVEYRYPIANNRAVNLAGRADRIDEHSDGTLQIIDYKSGNTPHLEFSSISDLFCGAPQQRISNIFQTLLYSMMLQRTHHRESYPSLYYASKMMDKEYSPKIRCCATNEDIERYSAVAESFEQELTTMLNELFDYDTPFKQVEDSEACKYCDYKRVCRR